MAGPDGFSFVKRVYDIHRAYIFCIRSIYLAYLNHFSIMLRGKHTYISTYMKDRMLGIYTIIFFSNTYLNFTPRYNMYVYELISISGQWVTLTQRNAVARFSVEE